MALTHHSFVTIKCDIPDCKDQKTSYVGAEDFWESGWNSENLFGNEVCLCPDHTKTLKEFLNDNN